MSLRVLFLFGRYLLPRPGWFGPCGFETSKVLDTPDMHAWRSPCFEVSSESIENEEDVISCPGPDDSLPHRIVKVRDLWREQDDFMEELVRPGFYIKKNGNCYVDVVSESAWSILFFCGMLFQTHAGTRSLPVPLVLAMCGRCQRILQESVALRLRLRFCHLLTSGNFGKRKMHGCIPWQRILRHVHKPCLHRLIWQSFGKKKMHGCNPWRSLHARRRILRLLLLHPPPQCWIELLPSKIAWQINRKWRRKKRESSNGENVNVEITLSLHGSSKVVAEREHWNSCAEVSSRERDSMLVDTRFRYEWFSRNSKAYERFVSKPWDELWTQCTPGILRDAHGDKKSAWNAFPPALEPLTWILWNMLILIHSCENIDR